MALGLHPRKAGHSVMAASRRSPGRAHWPPQCHQVYAGARLWSGSGLGNAFPMRRLGWCLCPVECLCVSRRSGPPPPHPPPTPPQPARPAPAFLSKLGSHRAPLPGPRLGRGPHAAPAKLQLPLVLGPSHPRPLNWGFRARTAMSLGSAGSRKRSISSPHLWYLSLGAMDTSSRKPSRRPLEVPGCPVAC